MKATTLEKPWRGCKRLQHHHYDSPADLGDWAERDQGDWSKVQDPWAGGKTKEELVHLLRHGDPATIQRVTDGLDWVNAALLPHTRKRRVSRSPFGVLNVPAYLAGHPEPCRRRLKQVSSQGEIRLWLTYVASSSMTPEEVEHWITILTGFAYGLAKIRPVRGTLVSFCTDFSEVYGCTMDFNTRPMDAATITALASVSSYRGAIITLKDRLLPNSFDHPILADYTPVLRHIGAKAGDLVSPVLTPWTYRRYKDLSVAEAVEQMILQSLRGEFPFPEFS